MLILLNLCHISLDLHLQVCQFTTISIRIKQGLSLITRWEIIAKRGVIARLSYNTSFGLYEKVDIFNNPVSDYQVGDYCQTRYYSSFEL